MKSFNESNLKPEILKAIGELGFETPTPIQEKAIPAVLESTQDLIALAQTGTGKTASFGLPIIHCLSDDISTVQAIVLCPTRELCLQITSDLNSFSKYMRNVSVVAVYGGASIETQIKDIKKGPQIIVGTPGRTLDLIKRRVLKIENVRWLVLDEADEMLNMGFREELDSILGNTPEDKQTLLFSATMPDGIRQIASNYMHSPIEISVGKKNIGATNVEHQYFLVRSQDKYVALKRIADMNPSIYSLVFCRTRAETKEVADLLIQDGYSADALHGDLSQSQRDHVMNRFKCKQLQMLVATDVAARGIDISELTHVINYSIPDDPEIYIHRSGRTGRAGKTGISIIITNTRDADRIRTLERMVGKKFAYKPIPSGVEICEKRLINLISKIETVEVNEEQIAPFLNVLNEKLECMDREDLYKRFISVEFNRFLEYYKDSKDINVSASRDRDRGDRNDRDRSDRNDRDRNNRDRSDRDRNRGDRDRNDSERGDRDNSNRGKSFGRQNLVRFFINVGSKQNLKIVDLIGLIKDSTDSRNIEIGKIDILGNFSFFEVKENMVETVMAGFQDAKFGKTKLVVEPSKPENPKTEEESHLRFDKRPRGGNGGDRFNKSGDRRRKKIA